MNRTVFEPCVTIDTSDTLSGDLALPVQVVDRRDKKLRDALCYHDPTTQYVIRKKRHLALVSLGDLFVAVRGYAPTIEEIYDRAALKGLRKPPSYSGIFFLVQNPHCLKNLGLSSCLIGSEPFTGSDGHSYIPQISSQGKLYLRARKADESVKWGPDERWLFETTAK